MKRINKMPKALLIAGSILLLLLGVSSLTDAQTYTSGLVSWWPGDDNFDDIVDDNTGSDAGGTTFTTGKVGQAFNFNGTANSFVTVGSNNMLPSSNQLTIDAWINPDFSQQNAIDSVLTKRDGCNSSGISYILHVIKFDPAFGGGHGGRPIGQLTLAMSDPSGSIVEATSGTTVLPNDGQFHHIAGTYDGFTMKVYIDGQLVGQAPRTGPILATTSSPVISHHGGACATRAAAVMDEIDFYDRPLSALEIQAIFNAGSAGKYETVPFTAFLHGSGAIANPATLFLDETAPTVTTARQKDSAGIKFAGGNPWKLIGTWTAAPTFSNGSLSALSDLHVWVGLKNSDDIGTRFDLAAEVWKNGTPVTEGETLCITGVTRNPALAKEVTVPFQPFSPTNFDGSSDVLSLKAFTRIGTNGSGGFCGGHSNAVGLRLYFDAVDRDARFGGNFD